MSKKKQDRLQGKLFELILRVLSDYPHRPLNYKQITKHVGKLNGDEEEYSKPEVIDALETLASSDKITPLDYGKYMYKPEREYRTGVIEITGKGAGYVSTNEDEEDIYIAPPHTSVALNGDKVKISVYSSGRNKMEGEVIEIIERNKKHYAGVIEVTPRFAFVIPDDSKVPVDIFVPLVYLNKAQQGQKVIVEITGWKKGDKNPTGKVIHVLGKPGENETEMHAILSEYGFPLSFPRDVEKEAEAISHSIPASEIKNRKDFRKITTFTIDPVDAKDFDDALSYRKFNNGNVEIGVHIADVTHYLIPGTAMDKEAYERGTSVYLVDRVIPMLPEKLSNEVCSLRPNEDKLCFSAVFEMNSQGAIINEWFGRTVIHSIRRFTYEEAQQVIETGKGDLSEIILEMDALAKKLRDDRFKKGAISFEKAEVKFILDEKGMPLGVYTKENKDSNKLIEEFMLLANRRVAEFASKKSGTKRTFVYRVHDVPVADKLSAFSTFAGRFGYRMNISNEKEIAGSLNKLLKDVYGKKEQNVLEQLAIRTMAKAIYTTENIGHYGLAFDYYSHFTSPIRRYPDVMVHRLLQHYLEGKASVNAKNFEAHCKHATDMEIRASQAERDSIKFKQVQFMQSQVGKEFPGIISGVTEWGLYVEITENKCEGMIRLRDLRDDYYEFDEKNFCIIGQRKRKKIQLGDSVNVRITRTDLMKRQLDMELVL